MNDMGGFVETAVLMRSIRSNKYSIAALIAALDIWNSRRGLSPPRIIIAKSGQEMLELASSLRHRGYTVIAAYSFMTTDLVEWLPDLRRELEGLKRMGIITVAGGSHPTGDPLGTLRLGFDYVVVGEGEEAFPALIAYLRGEGEARVAGVAYLYGENACYTGKARLERLDDYPNFPYWRGIFAPIELTRGCNYACLFCQVSFSQGGKLRHRSLESTLSLATESLKAGRRDLRFITPNAFSYLGDGVKPNIDGLCLLIEGLERLTKVYGGRVFLGTFPSEVRPEHAADGEAVRCIAGRVANKRVIIGAQSGSDRILRMVHRGHTVDDVINAVETLGKHGFGADVDIIIGFPGEEREDLEATVRLAEKLAFKYKARIHAHYFLPLPGTPLFDREPTKPPRDLMKRLYKLLGKGMLYGDWLRQYEQSWKIVRLYREKLIIGLRGYRLMKRCERLP
jgi:B12-binding domain/radical SAM domain protein